MQTVVLVLLALLTFVILFQYPLVAIVLAGLWALLASALTRSRQLENRLNELEQTLSGATGQHPKKPVTSTPTTPKTETGEVAKPPQADASTAETVTSAARTELAGDADFSVAAEKAAPTQPKPADRRGGDQDRFLDEPAVPPFVRVLFQRLWGWFTAGNVFVRIGVVILFIGMTFLVQHAIGRGMVPIGVRLSAVAVVAMLLLLWGWRLRDRRSNFALVVQGAGVGLLYLLIFSAFSLYNLIPSLPAFALLLLMVVLAAVLAVLQNARSLALFATVGGFLAPVLTSSGSNDYVGLFSYYTLLNLGILAIAWFRSWRLLNFVGFVFTFAISSLWGVLEYRPEFYVSVQPFLILFFLFYVGISILFAKHRRPLYRDYVDSTLVFGTPLLAFGLQSAMVSHYQYGIAISAGALGAFYVILAQALWSWRRDELKLLSQTFLSLGVVFLTLAVPFVIDGSLTGATWAIEGAGILWVSIKQEQKLRRLFGQALVMASGLILGYEIVALSGGLYGDAQPAFLNSAFIGCVIIAVAASASSWLLSRPFAGKLKLESWSQYGLLVYGLAVLLFGFEVQVIDFDLVQTEGHWLALLSVVSLLLFTLAGDKLAWRQAHWVSVGFILPLAVAAWLDFIRQPRLAADYGYLLWPLSLLAYGYALKRALPVVSRRTLLAGHIVWALVMVGLLFWEGLWQLLLGYGFLAVGFTWGADQWHWPQLKTLALGLLPVMALTALVAVLMEGSLGQLPSLAAGFSWSFAEGYLLWPLVLSMLVWCLWRFEQTKTPVPAWLHGLALLFLVAWVTWEASWHLLAYVGWLNAWHLALLPLASLLAFRWVMKPAFWPFTGHFIDYRRYALVPLALALVVWSFGQLATPADSSPLPWLPLINPLDIVQALVLMVAYLWFQRLTSTPSHFVSGQSVRVALLAFLFLWANVDLLRAAHHWWDIAWQWPHILAADLSQTLLSLFWALCGVLMTFYAGRKARRRLWLMGAGLLAVVIVKLFLVDFSASDTFERIVSFTGVGLLLVLVGYLSPIPPKAIPSSGAVKS